MNLQRPNGWPPAKRSLDQAARQDLSASHGLGRRDRWLCLAERVLGSWAPTLRVALLIVVIGMCVLSFAAATFGLLGVAAGLATFVTVLRLVPNGMHRQRDC